MRWFTISRKVSDGTNATKGLYLGPAIYNELKSNFAVLCVSESGDIRGEQNIRERLRKHFTKKKRSNCSRKRKRRENEEEDKTDERPKVFSFYGIGCGAFSELKRNIRQIRRSHRDERVSLALKYSLVQFFLTFNPNFRQDFERFDDIVEIYCKVIDDELNSKYTYHGEPDKGVAFIFKARLHDNTVEENHYCLGLKCKTGCTLGDYHI